MLPSRDENRQRHDARPNPGLQRLNASAMTGDVAWSRALGGQLTAVQTRYSLLGGPLVSEERQAASRVRANVVGGREWQRKELLPTGRHLLIERGQPRRGAGVPGHQVEDIDEIAFAEEPQRPRVQLRAQLVPAENLATGLDDSRFLLGDSLDRVPVTDGVDDGGIQTDRNRFHFVKRPLVRLVVLAGCRQD